MRFYCDSCGQTFEDDRDCEGDSCNRCDDGTICVEDDDFAVGENTFDQSHDY